MIYNLPLHSTGLAAGIVLIATHVAALLGKDHAIRFARALPRSRAMAAVLLSIAAVWAFWMVKDLDLGEFSPLRRFMLVGIVAGAFLSWFFVEEFLSVRALGMILLLAAEPLLESAVLRDEPSRLLLTILAYAWASAGLVFVGMPFVLRDLIGWCSATSLRWKLSCLAGIGYGVVLVLCALLLW